ncbi:hypothetical protein I317_04867 [Kwoniella heveanensis CBS 569]|nr:hypothetical protein I317_04867 [Kwoniella heveanensis CBS 569]
MTARYDPSSSSNFRHINSVHRSSDHGSLDSPPLPSMISNDPHDELSPTSSTAILTPETLDPVISTPKMSSDHAMLSSMSSQPTPKLVIPTHQDLSRGFPLLPPHHPLRSKMYSQPEKEKVTTPSSPAHTPKGHPINADRYFTFNTKTKSNPLTNPFTYGNRTTSLTYLLRIPRRLRPVLLLGVCVITFGLVFLSRAMSHARHMDSVIAYKHQMAFGRRELAAKTAAGQHPLLVSETLDAQKAEAVIASHSGVTSLAFESVEEELAALISFITSTTANALPALDPLEPLDPSVVLDFDPSGPNARDDLELLQNEINTIYPIVLVGKMRDPWHREIKRMLADYRIVPAPLIIDVDQRRDHSTIIPLLARLIGTTELPQLLLQGKSIGSYHDILDLRDQGLLRETIEESGAVSMRQLKKKKKGLKEKERIENERILGPAPIVAH